MGKSTWSMTRTGTGSLAGFKFQSELLLDGREEGWCELSPTGSSSGGPLQLQVVEVGEVCFIDHDAAGNLRELFSDRRHGEALAIEMGCAPVLIVLPPD